MTIPFAEYLRTTHLYAILMERTRDGHHRI
nr:MAG TPA: hypothetical protein [Caudoviricetes sp.]